ncbi:MAG TPA: M13 family metallopeptidase [Opitutus sp.]|nr:M13 family metallopeptidase [Opitutus sp.]
MRNQLLAGLLAAFCFTLVGRADLDPKNMDLSVKPQDDFDLFANGGWKKANPVPPAYSRWGSFDELAEHNREAIHHVLEQAMAAKQPTQIEQQVGDFFASGMDEAAIDAAGIAPLQAELDRIAAIQDGAGVETEIARLHRFGINAGFIFASEQDPKNSTMVIAGNGQAGLGLPDRDYYLKDDEKSKTLREQYVAHIAALFVLAGESADDAKAGAAAVMKLETALATGSKTRVALRDPVANYHKMPVADLQKLTPHFDWKKYFVAVDLPDPGEVDAGQPEFLQAFDAQLAAEPVAAWKSYLRWHLLHGTAAFLSPKFVDENFDFYGKKLSGTQQLRERWKRVADTIDASVGEALGQLYVKEYFPPESKARMLKLVNNLRAALHDRLETIEWMDDATRAKALAKLDAFGVKIGYPDKWIDYSKLKIDRGPYVSNVLRAREFNFARDMAKIGKPKDRTEWQMTPPTVNAYYDPTMNEIVFPAGILQPPFFDPKADDATNYGGIGAVIGHEMTHGFDDQGRQFDAQGNLTDWWTPQSAEKFKARAAAIVNQFNGYAPVDDQHINGELTQGENIADLGGLKIAFAALQKALVGQERREIDGFTPEQRFFLSWANVWHDNIRPQEELRRLKIDPHSPAHFRIDGPLSNLPEFYEAFNVPVGAPMRRAPEERVVIW